MAVAWSDPTLHHGRKPQGISHDHQPPSASLGSRDQTNRLPIALQIIRTIGTRPFLHLARLRTAFDSSRRFGRWRPLCGNCSNSSVRIIPCSLVELWCHRSDALMDSFDKRWLRLGTPGMGARSISMKERGLVQVYHSCLEVVGEYVYGSYSHFQTRREGTHNG